MPANPPDSKFRTSRGNECNGDINKLVLLIDDDDDDDDDMTVELGLGKVWLSCPKMKNRRPTKEEGRTTSPQST
jgi:hypothetical protein